MLLLLLLRLPLLLLILDVRHWLLWLLECGPAVHSLLLPRRCLICALLLYVRLHPGVLSALLLCWLQCVVMVLLLVLLLLCWLQRVLVLLLLLLHHLCKSRSCWACAAMLTHPVAVAGPGPLRISRHQAPAWHCSALHCMYNAPRQT
jgi:hypothetical protein